MRMVLGLINQFPLFSLSGNMYHVKKLWSARKYLPLSIYQLAA